MLASSRRCNAIVRPGSNGANQPCSARQLGQALLLSPSSSRTVQHGRDPCVASEAGARETWVKTTASTCGRDTLRRIPVRRLLFAQPVSELASGVACRFAVARRTIRSSRSTFRVGRRSTRLIVVVADGLFWLEARFPLAILPLAGQIASVAGCVERCCGAGGAAVRVVGDAGHFGRGGGVGGRALGGSRGRR